MKKAESLAHFYEKKFGWIPTDLEEKQAHLNVFDIEPMPEGEEPAPPYRRRDFYKITLLRAHGTTIHYADKSVVVDGYALVFSNPLIPYSWEGLSMVDEGKYCVFNHALFHRFAPLSEYPVFQSGGIHVFPLSQEQYQEVNAIYVRMKEELLSNYIYKYDVLRGCIFDVLHFAMKLHPDISNEKANGNAAERIANLFYELLNRQFPIDDLHRSVQLHSPSDFAKQLNVHVNHLNRSIKEVTGKTTGEAIAERFVQESKKLLQQTPMSIAEISNALGFSEPTRFNAFFKRHVRLAPSVFRKQ